MKLIRIQIIFILLVGVIFLLVPINSHAQSFCADNPSGQIESPGTVDQITSNMGPRDLSRSSCNNGTAVKPFTDPHSKNHPGTDYGFGCGTKIQGPPKGCVSTSGGTSTPPQTNAAGKVVGYGYRVNFDCGNGMTIQYAHLAGPNSYNPGSNTITTGDSGSGGCHLDYIVRIDGTPVDAQCATGIVSGNYAYGCRSTEHNKKCPTALGSQPNLCDQATKDALKQHSEEVFGSKITSTVPDGSTSGSGDDQGSGENETTPGQIFFLGTGDVGGGGGDVDEEVPDSDVDNDPEEEEDDPEDPADPYDQETSTPRCDNSTCITTKMISTAKNNNVDWAKIVANNDIIEPPKENECIDPRPTGFDAKRQKPGELISYEDGFCTQQGCTYIIEGGEGKCVP